LLKILSKVTGPTTGNITYKGRIGSLLEVGTGFHRELTGRENIFLNGAILGMTKAEIRSKLDEIVDFAGVERYIDTPVKRYSSGMMVRLGFAVAAHLEPEILVVDEVLAVGDFEFQKKAIGKMKQISAGEGRTILFVSHNMESIKNLCTTGILLQNGNIVFRGTAKETISNYKSGEILKLNTNNSIKWDIDNAPGNEKIKLLEIKIIPLKGEYISIASGFVIKYTIQNNMENSTLGTTIDIKTADDILMVHQGTMISLNRNSKKGIYNIEFEVMPFTLNAGTYKLSIIIGENKRYDIALFQNILGFEIDTGEGLKFDKKLPSLLHLDIKSQVDFKEIK